MGKPKSIRLGIEHVPGTEQFAEKANNLLESYVSEIRSRFPDSENYNQHAAFVSLILYEGGARANIKGHIANSANALLLSAWVMKRLCVRGNKLSLRLVLRNFWFLYKQMKAIGDI